MLVTGLLLLAGCASQMMKEYVGKDIQDVMVDYGKPNNAFDMPDGRRAFQWVKEDEYQTPTYIDSSEKTKTGRSGSKSWTSSNTVIDHGQTVHSKCIYTFFGVWDELRKTWVITGFKKPSFECE